MLIVIVVNSFCIASEQSWSFGIIHKLIKFKTGYLFDIYDNDDDDDDQEVSYLP